MKALIFTLSLLTISTISLAAQEGFGTGNTIEQKITCNLQNKIEIHKLTVVNGSLVSVIMASNPSTGHSWVSSEGLVSEFSLDSTEIGSGGVEKFELPLMNEENQFTFTYKRPWENNEISKCIIFVKVK